MNIQINKFTPVLLLSLMACPVPSNDKDIEDVPVILISPMQAKVDPLAEHLLSVRWKCAGEGCLDTGDIKRLSENISEYAGASRIEVSLMVGILMVENPWLDSLAVSSAGAIGLFQVMPMHRGAWASCSEAIETIRGSVCHGSSIIEDFLQRRGTREGALLAYNGCRGGPCEAYPEKVSTHSQQFIDKD